MHPAFSVIVFTTLSGAGYGLLALLGAVLAGLPPQWNADPDPTTAMSVLAGVVACILGCALAGIGLLSSMLHLGKPARAWRAFSQWRTSWLSREGVLALLAYVPALALVALLLLAWCGGDAQWARLARCAPWLGAMLAVLALATVGCTAMIYASLKPIPAWRQRLVVPAYFAFALLCGACLLAGVAALLRLDAATLRPLAGAIALLAMATTAIKLGYWRAIDRQALPATRGAAVGLPGREVGVFEPAHSEANYITREMAFVVARKHARRLRAIAAVAFGALPLLLALLAWRLPASAMLALPLSALAALCGAGIERWLFFAEARHMVTLYY